ncbi:hypothetical protein JXM67_05525 [candidate division WOR-3 bacterium]|nr:hypothetical protein [candidate division WOR-3 bacterium]
MIRMDLRVSGQQPKLTFLQFFLLFVGIFLGVSIIVTAALLLEWNSLGNLAEERNELAIMRDSLIQVAEEMNTYQTLHSRHQEIQHAIRDSRQETDINSSILRLLLSDLEPGMKLLSCRIESDSVIAHCLSPSNVKVARYVESLSRSKYVKVEKSEPQGIVQGLIEHRVLLRIP